jgi:hypothetical protein
VSHINGGGGGGVGWVDCCRREGQRSEECRCSSDRYKSGLGLHLKRRAMTDSSIVDKYDNLSISSFLSLWSVWRRET